MTANEVVVAGATFRYAHDGQPALRGLDLRAGGGKLVLLLGASGCGKTTATRLLNGLVPHFFEGGALDGSVDVCGMEPASVSVQRLAGAVGSVFQDPRSQFFATDVSSEIAFSCENLGVPALEMRRRVAEAAGACGVAHLMDRSIFDLSSGEKQAVAVASVLAMRPRVVVMDEPSANLDEVATARLRTIVETLLHRGVTVVVSEHRVHYLADLADEALLLRAGRVERRFAAGELARLTPEASHELGLRASSLDEVRAVPRAEARGPAVLEVRDVSFGYRGAPPVLKGTSFSVREGEVVGIVGRNGVGKSTLIDLVCGLKTECAARCPSAASRCGRRSACGQATWSCRIRIASCSRKASKPSCFWASVPTRRARRERAQRLRAWGLRGWRTVTRHRCREARSSGCPSRWPT